ncbi:MAG: nucleotidyltransferase family protein [Legionellaceae bacterium]|nr:nucleotidyltransferase family protein [Legionellaceae bacterium]
MWDSEKYTPEERVIRMCCRYALGYMEASECLPYLKLSLDETQFLILLHEERILLLVYQVLSGDLKIYVSPQFIENLSLRVKSILSHQLALMALERDVDQAFNAKKIPYTFLKGPALNRMLWGRRMMRYSGDLDVLVSPKDILKAHAILKMLHFKSEISEKSLRFHQKIYRITTKKDASYRREALSQKIELHWKTYCTEFVVKRDKAQNKRLDNEAYALYLCLHAAKHGWSRLIWLVDIIAFLQVKKVDIKSLRAYAKKQHIGPVVDEALLLARQWLGIHLIAHDTFETVKKRESWLEKRVLWARKKDLKDTLWGQLSKRFYMNAFCSSIFCQMRLWAQIFLGTMIMKLSKTL